jgi:nitrate reductase NapAB chaperone NapD
MGFLVHTLPESTQTIERSLQAMPEMTTYGIHQDCYIVAVAEVPSASLETSLDAVKALDGVITCYVTSVTVEDELP